MTHAEVDSIEARPNSRPGMREVAERAGVAMSSVSRVLSGHPDVSPRMRSVVMSAVKELGYRPDMLAQGLRSGKTYSVGFTVSDIANQAVTEVVTGAEKRLREDGYSLLLTNSEGDAELDAEHIRLLDRRRVDGLLLSLAAEDHPATLTALQEVAVPIVLIDRDVPAGIHVASVTFDHRIGMTAATEHLADLGHRHIALIIGGPERPARQRREAVEQTIAEAGGSCAVYEAKFTVKDGARATHEILSARTRPTAIIAAGNMLMQGALLALHEAGVEVGPEISFVGCDDVPVAELHQPPIAVVRRDTRGIGAAAAELLLAKLDNKPTNKDSTLPTEFVMRPSCAPAPR